MKRLTIDNPVPGGKAVIRPAAAKRMIEAGHAVMSSANSITLLENAHDAAEKHIADAWLWTRRRETPQDFGYDRINRTMTMDEAANIPVVMPEKLFRGKPLRAPVVGLIKFGVVKRSIPVTH